MEKIEKQIIKDFVLSFIFVLCMYGVINNPIIRPKAQPIPGNWSIQLMQHPLLLGFAGHNYLSLRNQDNETHQELHGLATDEKTNTWKYVGLSKGMVLKVWKFDNSIYYLSEKKNSGIILKEGNKDEILLIWDKILSCKEEINQRHIPYPNFGFKLTSKSENSNSVAYTLALCSDLEIKHIGLLTPGGRENLLK